MKHLHNNSVNKILKKHVQKLNRINVRLNFLNRSTLYFIHFWTRLNFLLAVHWLVWNILVLIRSVYPMQNIYFLKQYHQKSCSGMSVQKRISVCTSFSSTSNPLVVSTDNHTGENIFLHAQSYWIILPQSYGLRLVFYTR